MDMLNKQNTEAAAIEFIYAHAAQAPEVLEKLLDDGALVHTKYRTDLDTVRELSVDFTKQRLINAFQQPFEPATRVNTIEQFQITQHYITPNNSWALLIVQSEWNEQDERYADKVLKTCNNFILNMAMTDEGVKITKACFLKYKKPDFTTLAPGT